MVVQEISQAIIYFWEFKIFTWLQKKKKKQTNQKNKNKNKNKNKKTTTTKKIERESSCSISSLILHSVILSPPSYIADLTFN